MRDQVNSDATVGGMSIAPLFYANEPMDIKKQLKLQRKAEADAFMASLGKKASAETNKDIQMNYKTIMALQKVAAGLRKEAAAWNKMAFRNGAAQRAGGGLGKGALGESLSAKPDYPEIVAWEPPQKTSQQHMADAMRSYGKAYKGALKGFEGPAKAFGSMIRFGRDVARPFIPARPKAN